MKKSLLSIVLALAVMPVFAGPAEACSCIAERPKALAERAKVLFTGTVANIRAGQGSPVGDPGSGTRLMRIPNQTVAFDVETAFKGAVDQEVFVINPVSSTCGLHFEEGRRYTVFAYTVRSKLMTNSCSGTKLGSIDAVRYGVSEGKEIGGTPTSVDDQEPAAAPSQIRPAADDQEAVAPSQTLPVVAAVVLALVGGALFLARRRFARSPSG